MLEPTICDCDTCREVKKRILNPKCPYCGDHHDKRIHCIQEMNHTENYMLNADETMKQPKKKAFRGRIVSKMTAAKSDKTTKFFAMKNAEYFLDVADGKYSVYQEKDGALQALRYGEKWRDLTGDNLVFNLMVELIEAKKTIKRMEKTFGTISKNLKSTKAQILRGE